MYNAKILATALVIGLSGIAATASGAAAQMYG
jgi:hypothetical protein